MDAILNWRVVLQIGYHVLMYGLLIYGVLRLLKGNIKNVIYTTRDKMRMPSVQTKQYVENKTKSKFRKHLERLIESTTTSDQRTSVEIFCLLTLLILAISFIFVLRLTDDIRVSLIVSVMLSLMPYFVLWVRLNRIRAKASYDLLPATNKLLQKYRSNEFNLYYALRDVIEALDGPIKSAFSSILNAIQHRRDVEDAVQIFHYQINTTWSLQLAILIVEGINEDKIIDDALDRIARDMTETSIILEKEKSENRDAIQLGYFPIFALPITMFINERISQGRALQYHFNDPSGLKILIITLSVCSLSFLIALIMAKPRNDI